MASPGANDKTADVSPTHPMLLRSACRHCCATDEQGLSNAGRTAHRRSVHKKHLNGDLAHAHHHHHHHHQELSASEKHGVQSARYSDSTGLASSYLTNKHHTSSATQQEAVSLSKDIAEKLLNSLDSTLQKKTVSTLNIKEVTRKLFNKSYSDCASTLVHEDTYEDYSYSDGSNKYFDSGVSNFSFEADMSRTSIRPGTPRIMVQTRTPLPVDRLESNAVLANEEDGLLILHSGRHNGGLRAESGNLIHSNDDIGLSRIYSFNNSSKKTTPKSTTSRSTHLYSGSSDEEFYTSKSEDKSFHSATLSSKFMSFPLIDSISSLFRWLFCRCIYLSICEILLFDTWILSRSQTFGKKKLLCLLLFLLLLSWLFGLFPAVKLSGEHNPLHASKSSDSYGSLFSYDFSSIWSSNKHIEDSELPLPVCGSDETAESDSLPICPDDPGVTHSMLSSVWNLFYRTEENPGNAESVPLDTTNVQNSEISDEKIKMLALEVFRKESGQLMKDLSKTNTASDFEQSDLKKVQSHIGTVSSQYESLSASMQTLKREIKEQLRSDVIKNSDNQEQLLILNSKLQDLEEKLQSFETMLASAKNCCGNQTAYASAESHLDLLLMKVMAGHEDENQPVLSAFQNWLRSNFISRKNLSEEIASAVEQKYGNSFKMSEDTYEDIAVRVAESVFSRSMESFHDMMSNKSSSYYAQGEFTIDDVQKIVKEAILLYDADKTARVDYALESGGGSILSTRCSETYNAGTARLSILGLTLWYASKSPRTAIQPEFQPGECWAFHGSQGFLVIQLSATIKPTGFTLEHIPKSLSPAGIISAPKEFSVWALTSETSEDGVLLGEFMYDTAGEPLQYFPALNSIDGYYSIVELKIHSNWGNQKYTCLYRFRVHGTPL